MWVALWQPAKGNQVKYTVYTKPPRSLIQHILCIKGKKKNIYIYIYIYI